MTDYWDPLHDQRVEDRERDADAEHARESEIDDARRDQHEKGRHPW